MVHEEKRELKEWQLRDDARFREGMQARQDKLHKQLVEVGSLREGLLKEVRAAARQELEGKLAHARTEAPRRSCNLRPCPCPGAGAGA